MNSPNKLSFLLENAQQKYDESFELSIIKTELDLMNLCKAIEKSKIMALAIQSTNIDPMVSACAGISIACNLKTVYFIPRHNNEEKEINSLSLSTVLSSLKTLFADLTIEKILYHGSFDRIIAHNISTPIIGNIFDINIAASLISHDTLENSVELLQKFYSRNVMQSYTYQTNNQSDIQPFAIDSCLWENIASVHQSLFLSHILKIELTRHNALEYFFTTEMALQSILVKMQITGIKINSKKLKNLEMYIAKQLEILLHKINSYSQEQIDINIIPQIKKLLFDTLKLPGKRKIQQLQNNDSKKSEQDALQEMLLHISHRHEVVPLIIEYRKLCNVQKHSFDDLYACINPITQKIHPFWHQSMNESCALFATHPNLDNITNEKIDQKFSLQDCLIPLDDYIFMSIQHINTQEIKQTLIEIDAYIMTEQLDAMILMVLQDTIIVQVHYTDQEKMTLMGLHIQHKNKK
jgi:DNA polymerase-1